MLVIPKSTDSVSFLTLPLEIRQHVYGFLLPYSWRVQYQEKRAIVWKKGNITILSVCHQTFEECVELVYGHNDFELGVSLDRIAFQFRTVTVMGFIPSRSFLFVLDRTVDQNQLLVDRGGIGVGMGGGGLGALGATGTGDEQTQTRSKQYFPAALPRYVRRIRRFCVTIDHVDSYTGMIKYNCGGQGLNAGFEAQVKKLVEILEAVDEIHLLKIKLEHVAKTLATRRTIPLLGGEPESKPEVLQQVLEPLMRLRGIRKVELSGHMTPEFQASLKEAMERGGEMDLPKRQSRDWREESD